MFQVVCLLDDAMATGHHMLDAFNHTVCSCWHGTPCIAIWLC